MLQDLLEAEHAVRLRAAPLGCVDGAFLKCRQNVTAAHGNRGNTDVLVGLARDARRCPEAVLAEVVHRHDRLFEPAKGLGADRLQHEAFHVDAHFGPELVIKLFAATVLEPRQERDVIDTNTSASNGRTEQHRCRVLARPVVRPGKSAFDQTAVNRVQRLFHANDRARRQDLELDRAIGQGSHVIGELLQHEDFIGLGRDHRLYADNRFGICHGRRQHGRPHRRCSGDLLESITHFHPPRVGKLVIVWRVRDRFRPSRPAVLILSCARTLARRRGLAQ